MVLSFWELIICGFQLFRIYKLSTSGCSSIAVFSIMCLNCEKFKPVWLTLSKVCLMGSRSVSKLSEKRLREFDRERFVVLLVDSDFVKWFPWLVEMLLGNVVWSDVLIFLCWFLNLRGEAFEKLYLMDWRGMWRMLLVGPVVYKPWIRWHCSNLG